MENKAVKYNIRGIEMNILIIHTAFIGDIVLSTALVSKVKEKYPDSDIYYLTTPLGKEILKNNPKIKRELLSMIKEGRIRDLKPLFLL